MSSTDNKKTGIIEFLLNYFDIVKESQVKKSKSAERAEILKSSQTKPSLHKIQTLNQIIDKHLALETPVKQKSDIHYKQVKSWLNDWQEQTLNFIVLQKKSLKTIKINN